jgi:DNA-directed RNA polymerase subunit RPC12/RpoP
MINWATAISCERCGSSWNNSRVASYAREPFSETGYPLGHLANETKEGETIKPCIHCGRQMGLKKWDSWNGFLVECPNCGGLHGKHWKIRPIVFASILFNAFSFLFIMRPRNAVIALAGFAVFGVVGNYVLETGKAPDLLEVFGVIVFAIGPLLINGIVFVKHEHDLDNSAPPTQSLHR